MIPVLIFATAFACGRHLKQQHEIKRLQKQAVPVDSFMNFMNRIK